MKKKQMMCICFLAIGLLICGCVQEEETTTTTTTTTTTSTTTTTTTTTTSTTTSSTLAIDSSCIDYCRDNEYLGGTCRLNRFECEARLEEKVEERNLCPDRRLDTCCCQTNESVEKDIVIRYQISNS